jgi:hypothetical protein
MAKFEIGDRVRVRTDTNSQFRGRIGIVEKIPNRYAKVPDYTLRIEGLGFTPSCQISEQDLEAVSEK